MDFFDIKPIISKLPETTTFFVVGRGGCGKSYSIEQFAIEDAVFRDRQLCLVGRYKEDVLPASITQTFGHMTGYNPNTGTIPLYDIMKKSKWNEYECFDIIARSWEIWIVGFHNPDDKPIKLCQLGVYTCVQLSERFKRGSYPQVYNIFFDEFITRRRYIFGEHEPEEFTKIINTIARAGKKIRIFMCGNPDNEIDSNPYLLSYNIEYDTMEPMTAYLFNDDSVCFIRVSGDESDSYIVKETISIFGNVNKARAIGEVDRPKVRYIPEDFKSDFVPLIEVKTETSTIAVASPNIYRKSFYLYYGIYKGEKYLVTFNHKTFFTKINIISKYDSLEVTPSSDGKIIAYRYHFPGNLRPLESEVLTLIAQQKIYHESERLGNVLNNLLGM